jgi:hypothetical protein
VGADEASVCIKAYNISLRTWTKVKLGHVITAKEGEPVLLKAIDVTDCLDFDRHLGSKTASTFHIRNNLPKERAYVRQKIQQRRVSAAPASIISLSSSDEDGGNFASSQALTLKPFLAPAFLAAACSQAPLLRLNVQRHLMMCLPHESESMHHQAPHLSRLQLQVPSLRNSPAIILPYHLLLLHPCHAPVRQLQVKVRMMRLM